MIGVRSPAFRLVLPLMGCRIVLSVAGLGAARTVAGGKRYSMHVGRWVTHIVRNHSVDCLLSHDTSMANCPLTPAQEQLDVSGLMTSGANEAGVAYIDRQGRFCFDDHCPIVTDHTIAYVDNGRHITAQLSYAFRAAFRSAIGAA
jgi:hypothetical protein